MLDVNLDPRTVGWEQVDGHAPRFPDQPGLSALGKQLGLDHSLLGLAGLSIGIAHPQQQTPRRLAPGKTNDFFRWWRSRKAIHQHTACDGI